MKKFILIVLSITFMSVLTACGSTRMAGSAVQSDTKTATSSTFESAAGKKVRITTGNTEVIVTLNNSRAAADLVKMLPIETTLVERSNFAKSMRLPNRLSATEPTTRAYQIGTLNYWDDGPSVSIVYNASLEETIVPIIPIGRAEKGAEKMANTAGTVRLELVKDR